MLKAGQRVGPYRVLALIGSGATSEVFHAEHVWLDRPVALKILPPGESVDRFLDEARLLARLSHPGLVKIYDSDYLPDFGAYLAMELLEGESLQSRLQREGRLTLGEMVDIVGQLAQALEVVHAAGLVHRDLKPSNIFLCPDGVKLLDFGIAKQLNGSRRTEPGMLLGTPYYMPPEQCRGETNIDRRADLYALGAVLYEMAAGQPPFDGDTVDQVIAAHLFHAPPPLSGLAPGLPSRVGQVVATAMAKAPADRFSSALEMAAALSEIREQGPSTQPMRPLAKPTLTGKRPAAEPLPAPRESLPLPTIPRSSRAWVAIPLLAMMLVIGLVVTRLMRPAEVAAPPQIAQPTLPKPIAQPPIAQPAIAQPAQPEVAQPAQPEVAQPEVAHPHHKRALEAAKLAPEETPKREEVPPAAPAPMPHPKYMASGLIDPFAD